MRRVLYTRLQDVSAKAVLMAMAFHADDDGASVYPSVPSLARESGASDSAVRRAIHRLTTEGWIQLDGRARNNVKRYRIDVSMLATGPVNLTTQALSERQGSLVNLTPNLSVPVTNQSSAAGAARVLPIPNDGRTDSTLSLSEEVRVDSVADYFERAVREKGRAQIIESWRGNEAEKDMCKAFADAFPGVDVTKGDRAKWLKGARALLDLGVTRAELATVRNDAAAAYGGRGAKITHPGAAYEWVKGVRMSNSAPAAPAPSPELVAVTGGRRITGWAAQPDGSMAPTYG
jgi:hypothetical protein